MQTISIELPEKIFSSLRKDPQELAKEMRIIAAIKWYEIGEISQKNASEIAGLSRLEFINILAHYRVSTFQYTPDEIAEELASVNQESSN